LPNGFLIQSDQSLLHDISAMMGYSVGVIKLILSLRHSIIMSNPIQCLAQHHTVVEVKHKLITRSAANSRLRTRSCCSTCTMVAPYIVEAFQQDCERSRVCFLDHGLVGFGDHGKGSYSTSGNDSQSWPIRIVRDSVSLFFVFSHGGRKLWVLGGPR